MPPFNDKVLSRIATILARDTPPGDTPGSRLMGDALVAYLIAGVVFLIVAGVLMCWIEKRDLQDR